MYFIVGGLAWGAVIEVSPGDDLESLTETLSAGDEIVLADGLYTADSLEWSGEGTQDAPIIIRAAEGASPIVQIIANEDLTYDGTLVTISDATWLQVEGLSFVGSDDWRETEDPYYGMGISNSAHVSLTDVEIGQIPYTALYLSGDNSEILIERAHIHDTLGGSAISIGCGDASCWTSNTTITNSWIHGIGGEYNYGIYLAPGSQGITVSDTILYDVEYGGVYYGSAELGLLNVFEGNAVWSTGHHGLVLQGSSRARNNLIFNVDGSGIYTSDPEWDTFSDIVVSFNTVVNTEEWGVTLYDWYDQSGMVFANNAICNPNGYGATYEEPEEDTGVPPSENMLSSNVICGLVSGLDSVAGHFVAGAGFTDFMDVEGWNFYPTSDSLLLNAADPSGEAWIPDIDFNGLERDGGSPDVGAYEWFGGTNPGWSVQEGLKEFAVLEPEVEELVGGCCSSSESKESAILLIPLLGFGLSRRRRQR